MRVGCEFNPRIKELEVADGKYMYALAEELWPIARSLSGPGVRQTLSILERELPGFTRGRFRTGDRAFDWTIPKEWSVKSARLVDPVGRVVCDFNQNNLSLVGYSVPMRGKFPLEELQGHLHSLENQPDAVPYVTSYYRETWGFCLSHRTRSDLIDGLYDVQIDTELKNGFLDYGELVVPGKSSREVLFSTYICHPSMANNELSGPVLATALARRLQELEPTYTYRFLFLPETVGSLAYLAENLDAMKKKTLAGFVLTCMGDERTFSYIPSRLGGTVADRLALQVLNAMDLEYVSYEWFDRGSDERQFCAPGIDLPVCSVTRSKYGEYPEYHTDLDQLGTVVTAAGLQGSFDYFLGVVRTIESLRFPRVTVAGEPQLGARGLYPQTSVYGGSYSNAKAINDALSMFDGSHSLQEVAARIKLDVEEVESVLDLAVEHGLATE